MHVLNSFADHLDLKNVLDAQAGGLNMHQTPQQLDQEIITEGHCSVMLKVRCCRF